MPFTVGQYLTANDLKSQEDAHTLGYGVVNGLKVVPTDPASMDVQVETGKAYVADTLVVKGAITNLAVGAADPTNPRKDIVVCNSAGLLSIVAGTPEAALPGANVGVYTLNPEPPSIPANSIILAEIWVPAGATTITGSEIYDKRVFTVDRLGKSRLEWAVNKILKGAGAGSDPTEVDMPAGDMARAVYDPDLDGKIALAQLVDAVCSDAEADDKIGDHAAVSDAHHTPQVPTKEFFVPVTYGQTMTSYGERPCASCTSISDKGLISFKVPHDFSAIIEAVIQVFPKATQAEADWDIRSDYCAEGEENNTHEENDTISTYNVVESQLFEVDISGILSALVAGDNVGIGLFQETTGHDVDVIGVRFKYS